MLKHILISLLIVTGIFAIPAVLLFVAAVFSDSGTEVTSKAWYQDGIAEDEAEVAELLRSLDFMSGSRSELLAMPFLETVEEADVLALESLNQLALLKWTTLADPSEFEEFMLHPAIADGITDEETVFVTVAGNAYEWNPGADRHAVGSC